MNIALVSPGVPGVTTGNLRSSENYVSIFQELGHHVTFSPTWTPGGGGDLLVALHARKSHPSITRFRAQNPNKPIILVLTGTDIYPQAGPEAIDSIRLANRVVTLQDRAPEKIPAEFRGKNQTIVHGASPSGHAPVKTDDPFDVLVAGHLRDVKDPMRAALAARLLPAESKIRILHAGAILEEKYRAEVDAELRENPRYHHLGQFTPDDLKALNARSQLLVVSSLSEGGARIVGESIVERTPVLSSRIDGVLGLLGEGYPGYFPVRDTHALAALMARFESDPAFRNKLTETTLSLQPHFAPEKQTGAWNSLIANL